MIGFFAGDHAGGAAEETASQTALAGFGVGGVWGGLVFYAGDVVVVLGVAIPLKNH